MTSTFPEPPDGSVTDVKVAAGAAISPAKIAGTAVVTADSRLSDARTPTAHKATHAIGGTDALSPADIGAATAAALTSETSRATTAEGLAAQKASNLSDLANAGTARTNLGLGSAATQASTAFEAAGAVAAAKGLPLALTGATAATRYVGGTASGAPASGAFVVGDFVIDQTGKVYVCTTAGSPGTWTLSGASSAALVSFSPTGTIAATDAQAAIAEAASEAAQKAANLSDLASAATARTNLGLGTAATQASTAFEAAGAVAAAKGLPLALTGATAATRYVGGTATGAPASGTFAVGDFVIDQTGKVYVCTGAGTPGTWTVVGGGGVDVSASLGGQYFSPSWSAASSTATSPLGKLYLQPIMLGAGSVDRIAIHHLGVPTAGETCRLGIYSNGAGNYPGALLIDGGTVDLSTATGVKAVTISQAVTQGLYWLAAVRQGATNTATMAVYNSGNLGQSVVPMPIPATALYSETVAYVQTAVTAALPGTFTSTVTALVNDGTVPLIAVRRV